MKNKNWNWNLDTEESQYIKCISYLVDLVVSQLEARRLLCNPRSNPCLPLAPSEGHPGSRRPQWMPSDLKTGPRQRGALVDGSGRQGWAVVAGLLHTLVDCHESQIWSSLRLMRKWWSWKKIKLYKLCIWYIKDPFTHEAEYFFIQKKSSAGLDEKSIGRFTFLFLIITDLWM